ncbi:hypothetical protein BX286_4157 [Streptomyces sp. 3211.6]|uniref:hypothetical protein n=1 Tax=Streptomyces TaxID=1883 RepID=UPI0009A4A12E|nr:MULTISPECIES: hypothetical protein [Streptomyces]RKT06119.1 hypothetical protein BX286_4157 [Streptomyces sp. 3211.6]RPF46341.1 hypothetical protein EDD96_2912 [Streptomyces sp. Ag109_G2-6]
MPWRASAWNPRRPSRCGETSQESIGLGKVPVPDLTEVNAQEEFHAEPTTAPEFETARTRARRGR